MVLTEEGRKRLRKLMVIQEISQRDLALALGWKSHSYLGRLLRGEVRSIDPAAAATIAYYFGVGVDDLFLVKASTDGRQSVARSKRSAA